MGRYGVCRGRRGWEEGLVEGSDKVLARVRAPRESFHKSLHVAFFLVSYLGYRLYYEWQQVAITLLTC